jgi:toxin ParE1/3/4
MPEYRLTPAAERDMEAIWRYTSGQWGVAQASRYTDALTTAFEALAADPTRGKACDHIRAGYRFLGVERHMVYFRATPYGVAVVRILHGRMDAPRHL